LSLSVLREHLADIDAKRVILTHLSDDMLSQLSAVDLESAEDGKIVEF
jgi:hypothetical protein